MARSDKEMCQNITETQSMLDENRQFNVLLEIRSQLEETVRKNGVEVEELHQEIYELKLKSKTTASTARYFEEELSTARKHTTCRDVRQQLIAEKEQETSKLQRQVNELHSKIEQSQDAKQQLQNQVEQLNSLLEQHSNETIANVVSQSFNDEAGKLQQEKAELQKEFTNMKMKLLEDQKDLQKMKMEDAIYRQKFASKVQEIEEVQCQISSSITAIERKRVELMDQKVEKEAQQIEVQRHESKGNSLFSELEDRRVKADKKGISLNDQIEKMKKTYEKEKQRNHQLQMQMVSLLHMSRGDTDQTVMSELGTQLLQEREKKRDLIKKIYELKQKNREESLTVISEEFTQLVDGEESGDSGTKVKVDNYYIDYLVNVMKDEDEMISTLEGDLHTRDMLMRDNKVSRLEQRLYNAKYELGKCQTKELNLQLKLKELKLKYEPDSVTKKDEVFTNVEIIPLQNHKGNEENCDGKSIHTEESVKKAVSEDRVSFRKIVSISDTVTVKDTEGKTKNIKLSNAEQENQEKKSVQKKPKSKRVTNIVKFDETVPTVDCKQQ